MPATILGFFENYISTPGLFSDDELAMAKALAIPKWLKRSHIYSIKEWDVDFILLYAVVACGRI